MNVDEVVGCFGLPNCYGRRGVAFRPYSECFSKAFDFFKDNASLFGLALAVAGVFV